MNVINDYYDIVLILLKANPFTSLVVIRFRVMKHCYWKRINSQVTCFNRPSRIDKHSIVNYDISLTLFASILFLCVSAKR